MSTVLVTGAGRGMGLEFTRQLLDRGDTVIATLRNPAKAEALNELAGQFGDRLVLLTLDVASPASIAAAAGEIAKHTETLDLILNNAGINSRAVPDNQTNLRFGELEPTGILKMIEVNAIGPVLLTQELTGLLSKGVKPKVMTISSWLGSIGLKSSGGNYGYCASKATLNMLARAMAFDLAPMGITSVVINPGWVSTDMGGPNAKLTPADSVAGMLDVADQLTPDDAGKFYQWDGSEHAW